MTNMGIVAAVANVQFPKFTEKRRTKYQAFGAQIREAAQALKAKLVAQHPDFKAVPVELFETQRYCQSPFKFFAHPTIHRVWRGSRIFLGQDV